MRRKPLFPPPRGESGRRAHNKGRRSRSVLTVNGRVHITRRHWHIPGPSPDEGRTITPMDTALGMAAFGMADDARTTAVSRGARELMCRLNIEGGSFATAAEHLKRTAQLTISCELLRQIVEAEGREIALAQQRDMLAATWTAEDCTTDEGVARVYVGCDGVMTPMITDEEKRERRKKVVAKRRRRGPDQPALSPLPRRRRGTDQRYKEMKIVLHHDQHHRHSHASATVGDHRMAQRLMRRDAAKVGLHRADQKIANIDGADWIRGRLLDAKLDLDAIGLDFFHLSEHVHQAGRELFGQGADETSAWVGRVLHEVKHHGYQAMWETLQRIRRPLRSPRKRESVDRLAHYVASRREMIQYPTFLERGWHIACGPTESRCGTITRRLKQNGMRWDPDNAQAMSNLTALHQNQQWTAYWRLTA